MQQKFNLEKLENKVRVLTFFGFEKNYQKGIKDKNTLFFSNEKDLSFQDFDNDPPTKMKKFVRINSENVNISSKKKTKSNSSLLNRVLKKQKIFKIRRKRKYLIVKNNFKNF